MLYEFLDGGRFFSSPVAKDDRSIMNIPFRLKDDALDEEFLKQAKARSLTQLKGHRSVGGMRASIYNAMPVEESGRWSSSCASSKPEMADVLRILTLNSIAPVGLKRLPAERYSVGTNVQSPDAILVRSQDMHAMDIAQSVRQSEGPGPAPTISRSLP